MDLTTWQRDPDPALFPYDDVVAEYRRVGKHFVSRELLDELDRVRRALPPAQCPAGLRLARFLDSALDKHDGRFANPTYLALEQLGLPGADGCPEPGHALRTRDRLLVLLLADVMRFELSALDGETDLMPQMRPDRRTVSKRCRHALRAIGPALERLGLATPAAEDPLEAARAVAAEVLGGALPEERSTLQLTALHVSQVHDEYMFIRGLQAYEATFALIAVQLRWAVALLRRGQAEQATETIEAAAQILGESSQLWSYVATMQAESFLTFREFTDGASAIQSRNYKLMESLCRRPDPERLDSPAYESVPEVRAVATSGQPTIAGALDDAIAEGRLTPAAHTALSAAMDRFEAAVMKWRKTHHSLAARMLGDRRGTGDTAGVGYLREARTIPVFAGRCPMGHGAVAQPVTA
jgi:tryptophan 2,3-dioxygenase